jgi:PAS domain S-box-containing protein
VSDRRKNVSLEQLGTSVLLDSMPEAVFIFDRHGNVIEANHAASSLAGEKNLRGKSARELGRRLRVLDKDTLEDFPRHTLERALRSEVVSNEQRIFDRAGKGRVESLVSASAIRNRDGAITGGVVVVRDVSELHRLQRRLADTDRHLAIGQMAAGIAHDVNNVLTTISQATTLLAVAVEQGPTERRDLYLKMVQNAVDRGTEIVQRVRDYIRGGKGEREPLDLEEVLREALELTRPLLDATHTDNGSHKITVHRDLRPARVLGNCADLRRAFANLILNAIQAMPRGGTLTLGCRQLHRCAMVSIKDTGMGIPPQNRQRVFMPYYTTKTRGTGLGLSGAQRIVQSLGGNISLHSEVGKGTEFTVELPLIEEEQKKAA